MAATIAFTYHVLTRETVIHTDGIVAGTFQEITATPTPAPLKTGLIPVKLAIPSLELHNVIVEHVGLDAQKRMDVPADPLNVAWYEPGTTPGESGNAVIAGHFDLSNGAPGVFANIGELEAGDTIEVFDETGKKLTFGVVDKQVFSDADFPISLVFGKHDTQRLNLITCSGEFDTVTKNYSHRLVVFTELVDEP